MGESGKRYFIATEFIEGPTLRELSEAAGETGEAIEVAIQIAGALSRRTPPESFTATSSPKISCCGPTVT